MVGDVEHLGGGFVFSGEFGEGDGACGGLVVDWGVVDGDGVVGDGGFVGVDDEGGGGFGVLCGF